MTFFVQAHQVEEEGLGDTVVLLQAYLGLAWTLGCVAFGLLVVHRSVECRIARQYLTQAAVFVCGLCILALTAVQGNYHGYVMFAWIYGKVKLLFVKKLIEGFLLSIFEKGKKCRIDKKMLDNSSCDNRKYVLNLIYMI